MCVWIDLWLIYPYIESWEKDSIWFDFWTCPKMKWFMNNLIFPKAITFVQLKWLQCSNHTQFNSCLCWNVGESYLCSSAQVDGHRQCSFIIKIFYILSVLKNSTKTGRENTIATEKQLTFSTFCCYFCCIVVSNSIPI